MSAFLAIIRKQLSEARWMLGISSAALFGLGWLFVAITLRIESRMAAAGDPGGRMRRGAFLRSMGGEAMDFSSTAIEVMLWGHPFLLLFIVVWAVGRASAAPAGEVERGTVDLILSRPVARASYLAAQVVVAVIGLVLLTGALIAGHRAGGLYYPVADPPTWVALLKPAANLSALGLAIYGYTFLLSALDRVRWRTTLAGSALTLGGFIALVIAGLPTMEDWKWLENLSVFKAYQPVEVAVAGETFAWNSGILAGIGLAGIVGGFLAFRWRDIPSSS